MLLKFENMKGNEQYIDDDKNFQKLGLWGFLLFHVQGRGMRVLVNPWETCLSKISALESANAIKTKFLTNIFKDFACFLGAADLSN